ncbi:MAG TPA: efflux RND transporter periplasmic adaptor subunit, partial [Sphingobium sp.]
RNEAQRRDVKIGQVSDKGIAVTQGLNGDEQIIMSAGAFLTPGQKVKPEVLKAR